MQSGATHVELKALRRLGWSISDLAREFGLSRTTVYKELASPEPRRYRPRPRPAALSEAQLVHVERRLMVCPAIRGTDLHAEVRADYGYEGSYPAFQRQLRQLRPAVVRDPQIRFETDPGVQTQADWATLGHWPLGDKMVELHVMVAILGCSRAPAMRFALDTTRLTSLERLTWCLHDLGGVTREILTDRDPAFCIGQTANGAAILAPEWVDLCQLLGMVPKACRPYEAGESVKYVAERLGDREETVVETYAHVTPRMRSSAVSKVRGFLGSDPGVRDAAVVRPVVDTDAALREPPVEPPGWPEVSFGER